MPRKGENIYKRKDGRWEGRYVKGRDGKKAIYGYPEFSFLYTSPYLRNQSYRTEYVAQGSSAAIGTYLQPWSIMAM